MIKKFILIPIIFASNIVWANNVFLEESTNGDNYIILKFENDSDQTCESFIELEYFGKLFSSSSSEDWHKKVEGKFSIVANSTHSVEYYDSMAKDWRVDVQWTKCD
ncbi:hypothetical protein L1D37_18145 [Vibrio sp. Isolate33]|uniref:hypothetical protein n=1 Tax=Vibrio sp. Isolate33 TaxID=2908539 RepID=UPI001EFC9198|nr:hypothetical protein [Vibrio sp. Isolate33]MCG9545661.1 hypothetical protein [Vibrio sp. Isolate33]